MKKKISLFCLLISLLLLSFSSVSTVYAVAEDQVYLGGMPAGFTLSTRGAYVVGVCDVVTENGIVSPSKDSDIRVGDVILYIDGYAINNSSDIETGISGRDCVTAEIVRDGDNVKKLLKPVIDMSGHYKIGVFVKDSVSGIGTVTFIKGNRFASLGHPVINDNNEIIKITGGEVFDCRVTGVVKGERGKAGELKGVFLKNNSIATIDKNLESGVYGKLKGDFDYSILKKIEIGTAEIGSASIYSTINGVVPKEYKISIVKTDNFSETKNFVIKIDDENLLNETGGIVQGMSGSPIVQGGKLVGAVTHVFINDPTRGFGISINNMIDN